MSDFCLDPNHLGSLYTAHQAFNFTSLHSDIRKSELHLVVCLRSWRNIMLLVNQYYLCSPFSMPSDQNIVEPESTRELH